MEKSFSKFSLCCLVFVSVMAFFSSAVSASDKLLDIISGELQREMNILSKQETPPYFISYQVRDLHKESINAALGSLLSSSSDNYRYFSADVRVGSYKLDNTHELKDRDDYMPGGAVMLALDGNYDSICGAIWQETNRQYRQAVERITTVKTNMTIKIADEDSSDDFSIESVHPTYYEPELNAEKLIGNKEKWTEKMRRLSALFSVNKDIYGGEANFDFTLERKYNVNTEGTKIVQNQVYARIFVSAFTKADDGMEMPLYKSYFASTPAGLPSEEKIAEDIKDMIDKLNNLRTAPIVEPYTGPAILSGRASAVFFHEILGHRVEGHRQKSASEGQTFKKQVGQRILPEGMDVVFNPTLKRIGDTDLMGFYIFDDEGVKANVVDVVENGILKNFLMSRSPIENFPLSNGHGRSQAGKDVVSRQSNLIVKSSVTINDKEMRSKLIELCKKQGKPFGLYFKDIEGGFTFTGRTIPNVFNLQPTEVYRIYTDGRPDELVRGADLVGTPLVMFSMISEAGDKPEIFNGVCGAESGYVPVSATSPALLVTQVEVQKKDKSLDKPPVLPRPDMK